MYLGLRPNFLFYQLKEPSLTKYMKE